MQLWSTLVQELLYCLVWPQSQLQGLSDIFVDNKNVYPLQQKIYDKSLYVQDWLSYNVMALQMVALSFII